MIAPFVDQVNDWFANSRVLAFGTTVLIQITLLLILALALSRLFRRDPAMRYCLLLSALVCVTVIPMLTAGFQRVGFSFLAVTWTAGPTHQPAPIDRDASFDIGVDEEMLIPPKNADGGVDHVTAGAASGETALPLAAAPSLSVVLPWAKSIAFSIWIAGCCIGFFSLARSHLKVCRILRTARPADMARLSRVKREVCRILGVKSLPPLVCSPCVDSPTVAGMLRARIVLPTRLAGILSPRELRDVLLHETAHVLRRDQLVLLLQQIIGVLLWPHPMIHLLNALLARAREEVCDNYVLEVAAPTEYGHTLLRVCELMPAPQTLRGTTGMLGGRWKLEDRIADLLDTRRNSMIHLQATRTLAITLCALSLLVLLAGSQLSWAAGPPDSETSDDARQPDQSASPTASEAEVADAVQGTVKLLKRRTMPDADAEGKESLLDLFAIDVTSGEVVVVAKRPQPELTYCGTPSWSRDGGKILFDATPGKVWSRTRLLVVDLLQMSADPVDLGAGNCPTLSPDGKQIAFLLNAAGGGGGIWIMNSDGTNRRRLGGSGIPKWSPDGKNLLLTSFSTDRDLSLINVETGAIEPIQFAGHRFYSRAGWGGDGDTILSVVGSDRGTEIALVDISTPAAAKIKRVLWSRGDGSSAAPTCPVYSAKAQRCVFTGRGKTGTALYMLDTSEKGTPVRVEPQIEDNFMTSLGMSPDGRYVLFCSDRLVRKTQ